SATALGVGEGELPSRSNYFFGSDSSRWRTDVPNFARVTYPDVFPGVALSYYGTSQRQLEYDFIAAPGADLSAIQLEFAGAESVRVDGQGNLVLRTAGGELIQRSPVIYQQGAAARSPVSGRYVLRQGNRVG